MSTVARAPWLTALIAFVTMALATFAIAFLIEALRLLAHRRLVQRELQRLAQRGADGAAPRATSLLRTQGKGLPPWLKPLLARVPRLQDLHHFLEQSGAALGLGAFLALSLGTAVAVGFALTALGLGLEGAAPAAATGAALPYLWLVRKRRKRMNAFEAHFPEAIDLLTRSIRAGHGVSTGLGMVAEEAAEPVAGEFRQVFEELRYGLPLDEALKSLSDRVSLPDVRIFATALLIQRDVGGNLAEILDKLSEVIRERFTFRRQLRTHTAQGRMTGIVLGAAPFVAGGGMFLLNPDYMRPLFEEPFGRLLLSFALGMQVIGFFVIRRITDVEF
ncbi:MAG: type II secretion system F family protein [Gemmatimonadota bacterium]